MLQRVFRRGAVALTAFPIVVAGAAAAQATDLYAKRFASYAEKLAGAEVGFEQDRETGASLTRALLFLADAQHPEGSWDAAHTDPGRGAAGPNRVGVSGLALLAFVEGGSTPQAGPFKQVLARGVQWLLERQDPESGLVGERVGHAYLYDHAIATLALCEVQRRAPSDELAAACQRAVDCALRARNPYGGWRYDLPPVGDNDTSVTGWMVCALKSAERAGLRTDSQAFFGAIAWLDEVTDPDTGRTGYDSRGSRSSRISGVNDSFPTDRGEAMTAVALACRLLVGQKERSTPVIAKHAELLARVPPAWEPGQRRVDMIHWYFGARAMHALGGERWKAWREPLVAALLAGQERDGSWPPVGPWGPIGGRSYATALMALCLAEAGTAASPLAQVEWTAPEPEEQPIAVDVEAPETEAREIETPGIEVAADQRPTGGHDVQRAVSAGLAWLERHQAPDGRWDCDEFMGHDPPDDRCTGPGDPLHDVGVTGLALLAFMGDGNTLRLGPYKDVVMSGVKWLRHQQDFESGLIGEQIGHAFLYDHAIASLAVNRAYGPSRWPLIKGTAQKSVNYILKARNPYGAWRYEVPPVGDNDTSVTGWMVFALKSAEDADLKVEKDALVGALNWFDEVTDPANGRVGYDSMGSASSRIIGVNDHYPTDRGEGMTAVGMRCRFLLGQDPQDTPILVKHADLLLRTLPRWNPEAYGCDVYYWAHATPAMRSMGGRHWAAWQRALHDAAIGPQRRDGAHAGSWDPVGPWGHAGGRVYSTAMMVLALEASRP